MPGCSSTVASPAGGAPAGFAAASLGSQMRYLPAASAPKMAKQMTETTAHASKPFPDDAGVPAFEAPEAWSARGQNGARPGFARGLS